MSMISLSSCCLVLQTLLLEVWGFLSWCIMCVGIKCRKDLTHHLVVELHCLLQLRDTLHQLYKKHGLSVLLTIFGYKYGITHRNSVLNIRVVLTQGLIE